jgi:hypothetical protein
MGRMHPKRELNDPARSLIVNLSRNGGKTSPSPQRYHEPDGGSAPSRDEGTRKRSNSDHSIGIVT